MPFDVRDFPGALPEDRAAGRRNRRLVATWLFSVAGMILVMVVLGGVTRLTGSGLSIMEWAPVSGILPPLNHADWEKLFHLYQQIPQYALLHAGLRPEGLPAHLLAGMGPSTLGPADRPGLPGAAGLVLGHRPASSAACAPGSLLLFLLGGLQGAVGWFMVASGFFPDATAVSPYRLVIHLALALVLYAAIVWTGLTVLQPDADAPAADLPRCARSPSPAARWSR